jgi:hypothetical protein
VDGDAVIVSSWSIDGDGRVRQTWPEPEPSTRVQRCSACRQEGHNIARCPDVGDGLTMAERVRRIVDARERSRTADELARYGRIADAVKEALPVDEEADRAVTRALSERSRNYTPRKL